MNCQSIDLMHQPRACSGALQCFVNVHSVSELYMFVYLCRIECVEEQMLLAGIRSGVLDGVLQ